MFDVTIRESYDTNATTPEGEPLIVHLEVYYDNREVVATVQAARPVRDMEFPNRSWYENGMGMVTGYGPAVIVDTNELNYDGPINEDLVEDVAYDMFRRLDSDFSVLIEALRAEGHGDLADMLEDSE